MTTTSSTLVSSESLSTWSDPVDLARLAGRFTLKNLDPRLPADGVDLQDVMPPEQFGEGPWAAGGEVALTPASDLFAAGATAAWLLAGGATFAPPAGGKLTLDGTRGHPLRQPGAMRAHLAALLPPAGEGGGEAAGEAVRLRALLEACLEPDPALRPASAAEALRALQGAP